MTLAQVNTKIADQLAAMVKNPSMITPAALDYLATLEGRREALAFMESIPAEVRGRAARETLANITENSGNLRGAEVNITLGKLNVYGAFAKMV